MGKTQDQGDRIDLGQDIPIFLRIHKHLLAPVTCRVCTDDGTYA